MIENTFKLIVGYDLVLAYPLLSSQIDNTIYINVYEFLYNS